MSGPFAERTPVWARARTRYAKAGSGLYERRGQTIVQVEVPAARVAPLELRPRAAHLLLSPPPTVDLDRRPCGCTAAQQKPHLMLRREGDEADPWRCPLDQTPVDPVEAIEITVDLSELDRCAHQGCWGRVARDGLCFFHRALRQGQGPRRR